MRQLALTFDTESPGQAHHSPAVPERILEVLAEREVKATFFIQGRWAQSEPAVVELIRKAGHTIGLHSHFHAPWDSMTRDGFREDIEAAETALGKLGIDPKPYARAPFGRLGNHEALLNELGYQHFGWSQDPGDWRPETTKDHIVQTAAKGGTILLHSWPMTTARALPAILDLDVEFVTL